MTSFSSGPRRFGPLLCAAALLGGASAQGADLSLPDFLGALTGHPELLAAGAGLEAARLQLSATRDPVALTATGAYNRIDLDDALTAAQAPTDPGDGSGAGASVPSQTGYTASAGLVFRPFAYGELADTLTQLEVDLQTRQLDFSTAQAGLEARALEAALQLRLAGRSTELSAAGVAAAADGLAATRLRAERGAANDRELREAEVALLEARTLSQNAQLDTESARLNLQTLVGDTPPPSEDALEALQPPAVQTPVSVLQTELQTRLAALPLAAVQRALLPVASASYSYNVSDYSSVSAAIDSSSLQPQVGFSYQDPARTLPESAVDGVLSLSLSANISLGAVDALGAAERQGAAAEAALRAAREGGALQETALRAAYTRAGRDANLERRTFTNAQTSYEENVTRQELGLAAPLETRTALIELLQADLERRTAELTELGALLDLYELYALPPSETLR